MKSPNRLLRLDPLNKLEPAGHSLHVDQSGIWNAGNALQQITYANRDRSAESNGDKFKRVGARFDDHPCFSHCGRKGAAARLLKVCMPTDDLGTALNVSFKLGNKRPRRRPVLRVSDVLQCFIQRHGYPKVRSRLVELEQVAVNRLTSYFEQTGLIDVSQAVA